MPYLLVLFQVAGNLGKRNKVISGSGEKEHHARKPKDRTCRKNSSPQATVRRLLFLPPTSITQQQKELLCFLTWRHFIKRCRW